MGTYSANYNLFLTAEQDEVDVLLNITNNFSALDTIIKNIDMTSAANLLAHEADTTNIHGITDTALLVTTDTAQTISGSKEFVSNVVIPAGSTANPALRVGGSGVDTGLSHSGGSLRVVGSNQVWFTFGVGGVSTSKSFNPTNDLSIALGSATARWLRMHSAEVVGYALDAAGKPIVARGFAGQTANLQEWQNSAGSVLASITAGGAAQISQQLTIAAPVQSSANLHVNTTSAPWIGVIVRGSASQSANLQEWRDSGNAVLSRIDSAGQFTTLGTMTINDISGQSHLFVGNSSGSTSLRLRRGTTAHDNYIDWQTGGTPTWRMGRLGSGATEDLSLIYAPSAFSATIWSAGSGAMLQRANNNGVVPLTVRGAASQVGNLQEWQDSSNNVLTSISALGYYNTNVTSANAQDLLWRVGVGGTRYVEVRHAPAVTDGMLGVQTGDASRIGIRVRGSVSQTADLQQWQNSAGTVIGQITPLGDFIAGANFQGDYFADKANTKGYIRTTSAGINFEFYNRQAANIPMVITGHASQTADLVRWRDASSVVLASISANGNLVLDPVATDNGIYMVSGGTTEILRIVRGLAANGSTVVPVIRTASSSNRPLTIEPGHNAGTPLVVRGVAGQTATLTEWMDNTGTILASVSAAGALLGAAGTFGTAFAAARVNISTVQSTTVGAAIRGAASQTANLQEWQDSSGSVLANITAAGIIATQRYRITGATASGDTAIDFRVSGDAVFRYSVDVDGKTWWGPGGAVAMDTNLYRSTTDVLKTDDSFHANALKIAGSALIGSLGSPTGYQLRIENANASRVPIVTLGFAGQTADQQQWLDSGGVVLARISNTGHIRAADGSSGAAGYGFQSDTDTGLQLVSADRMRINAGALPGFEIRNVAATIQLGFYGVGTVAQPAGIAAVAAAAGDPPTAAEFNALVTAFNSLVDKLETLGLLAVL